jgi:hypothetical protein
MLTARLQATRSQTMMLEKLIDSEKLRAWASWPAM